MATFRRLTLIELRDRLRGIAGWDVQLAGKANGAATVQAVVTLEAADKEVVSNDAIVETLRVSVLIKARKADASAAALPEGDEGSPELYLDRLVELAEGRLFAPVTWSTSPKLIEIEPVAFHQLLPDDEKLAVHAVYGLLQLQAKLEHGLAGPGVTP